MRYRTSMGRWFAAQLFSVRVSLCIRACSWLRASLAVETVAILPLFLSGALALVSLMNLWAMQTRTLCALCDQAKVQALAAWDSDEEDVVAGRTWKYQPFGGLLPLSGIPMQNGVRVHAWSGGSFGGSGASEAEEMVLVTVSGTVYHTDPECSYLNPSVHAEAGSSVSTLRNRSGERYHACESCSDHQKPAAVVYITDNGNRYHNLSTCSGLRRTLCLVPLSEVAGMHECSRCRQRGGA